MVSPFSLLPCRGMEFFSCWPVAFLRGKTILAFCNRTSHMGGLCHGWGGRVGFAPQGCVQVLMTGTEDLARSACSTGTFPFLITCFVPRWSGISRRQQRENHPDERGGREPILTGGAGGRGAGGGPGPLPGGGASPPRHAACRHPTQQYPPCRHSPRSVLLIRVLIKCFWSFWSRILPSSRKKY